GINRPTRPLYVIFDQTATEDHCDGNPAEFRHDHVLSVAPGDPGYTGAWTLVLLVEASPGSIDLASRPFIAAQQVAAAIAAGTLVDVPSLFSPKAPPTMVAPVIGRSSRGNHATLRGLMAGGPPPCLPPSAVPAPRNPRRLVMADHCPAASRVRTRGEEGD